MAARRSRTGPAPGRGYSSRWGPGLATICSISAYRLGCRVAKARSSSCHAPPGCRAGGPAGRRCRGLLGRAALLPLGHDGQGPHVVQPVGQLDDQDPPVVGHGHEHLADRGRLLGLLGVELEAVELGHAVDDEGHGLRRSPSMTSSGEPGVLHGVVQQGGGHGLGVEAQVGHDAGHGDGVGDVGLARAAELACRPRGGGGRTRPGEGSTGRAGPPRLLAPARALEHSSRCLCRMESPASGPPSIQATRQGKYGTRLSLQIQRGKPRSALAPALAFALARPGTLRRLPAALPG
jgi:hypothetical protein